MVDAQEPLLPVILGPTGSGKTALSVALALRFGGEVVSCDSVAVYRDFEIGTAKPSPAERAQAPHHLIDIVSPECAHTAGDYSRDARAVIGDIAGRGRLPIVCGGTGLYLRALLNGLFAGPQRSEEIRERLRRSVIRHGTRPAARHAGGWLHEVLRRLDPAAAARIHANDTPKLMRAIEVTLAAREPITEAWKRRGEPLRGFRVLRIGLAPERHLLYARIDARAEAMFAHGLVEETARLMGRYGPGLKLFDTLGYRQAKAVLSGELSLTAAVARARQGHRNLAKRQGTWFRREPDVQWLSGFGDETAVMEAAASLIAAGLMARPT
ncbi:MAG: tRNA (adenosine(37)-N6)-dimethylallyltransferase MiaA [Acidobacteriaceae bacterium]